MAGTLRILDKRSVISRISGILAIWRPQEPVLFCGLVQFVIIDYSPERRSFVARQFLYLDLFSFIRHKQIFIVSID